jgi:DNA-binding PadR family transcriptional regulator
MPRSSSSPSALGIALLGQLTRRPRTGYELARSMERPVGYFWSAHHGQIYPELARLEAAGLVRHEVVEGAGPRPTKRYAATAAGTAALREWVVSDFDPGPARDLEHLRVWSLWTVDRHAARGLVRQLRERRSAQVADWERQREEVAAQAGADDPSSPEFASLMSVEGGVRTARALVEWCDWMLERLAGAGVEPPAPPQGRS